MNINKTRRSSAAISLVLLGGTSLSLVGCNKPSEPPVQQTQNQAEVQQTFITEEAKALQEQAAALQEQAAQLEAQALQEIQNAQQELGETAEAVADSGSGIGTMLGAAAAGAAAGYLASKAANGRQTAAQAAQTAQTPQTTQQPVNSNASQQQGKQRISAAQATRDNKTGTSRQGFGATGKSSGAAS